MRVIHKWARALVRRIRVASRWKTARPHQELGTLTYRCNICGRLVQAHVRDLTREQRSCSGCGSTVRMRSIVHMLSMELFGESLCLPDFPRRPEIIGMGLSDWEAYAGPLSEKLGYTNTFLHQEPKLDITDIDPALVGTLDFLIASDVFEHVQPPVSVSFANARRLLKDSGVLIFTVPYAFLPGEKTREHFPDLHDYQIVETGTAKRLLLNTTRTGVQQVFDDLVFHGGGGLTLEMRVFTKDSLMEEFARAGFGDVKIYNEPVFEHGIYWSQNWSLPMVARVAGRSDIRHS